MINDYLLFLWQIRYSSDSSHLWQYQGRRYFTKDIALEFLQIQLPSDQWSHNREVTTNEILSQPLSNNSKKNIRNYYTNTLEDTGNSFKSFALPRRATAVNKNDWFCCTWAQTQRTADTWILGKTQCLNISVCQAPLLQGKGRWHFGSGICWEPSHSSTLNFAVLSLLWHRLSR